MAQININTLENKIKCMRVGKTPVQGVKVGDNRKECKQIPLKVTVTKCTIHIKKIVKEQIKIFRNDDFYVSFQIYEKKSQA